MIYSEDERMEIALFRYGIISSYIIGGAESGKSIHAYFTEIQDRVYMAPGGKQTRYSCNTMERWYRAYRKEGIDGLKPAVRSDKGKPRKISDDVKSVIHYYVEQYPRLPATVIYQTLIDNGDMGSGDASLSTITREVTRQKAALKIVSPGKDMRRYEREHINEVWCADTCHGPSLVIDGIRRSTYIIGFIDDASRFIVGIDIFFADNTVNLMAVAKSAVSRFGKPKMWNFDNGPNYSSNQMKLLAARIGTAINYDPPYTPTSKSKIERYWRTLKDHFLAGIRPSDYHSLSQLREDLLAYVQKYNQTVHSSIGMTPQERFFQESEKIIRMNPEEIEVSFLIEEIRKVSNDSVVVLDGKDYEVDSMYRGLKLKIRYSPDMKKVFIIDDDTGEVRALKLLDKHANAKTKRRKVKYTEES